jgi:hypothetical protein
VFSSMYMFTMYYNSLLFLLYYHDAVLLPMLFCILLSVHQTARRRGGQHNGASRQTNIQGTTKSQRYIPKLQGSRRFLGAERNCLFSPCW